MSYFSKNLKYLRENIKKISQNKLSELVGVNQTSITRWENGEVSPSLDNLLDLSKVLNVSMSDLTDTDLTTQDKFEEDYSTNILFNKFKELSNEDKELISGLIDTRRKQIDKELGEEE